MKHAIGIVTLIGMVASVLSPPLGAQQGQLTDVAIQGFVYEPQRLSPTGARIQALTVPQGFRVQRFAEGLDNPRMLAVADDGTVYVTQRTPGNLVMPRDTDGDSIADIQKIVVRQRQLHGIVIRGREIFLADIKAVYAGDILPNGRIGQRRIVRSGLPDGGQHPNRTHAFSPDGELFVSVGDLPHPYQFQIFALDTKLNLPDGFNRHALLQAMRGHVLAEGEPVGMFQAPAQP